MKPKSALRLLLISYSLVTFSSAATLTWDNGAATGNWNSTDLNWTGVAWNNTNPDDAVFDATGVGIVTLTEAITAGSISFDTAGYTIDTSTLGLTLNTGITANQNATIQSGVDGSIILGADNAWSVASSRTLTVSSLISGDFGITKSEAGTLTLSGPNTYTGDTTLNGGTVVISNATSLGAGDVLVTGNSRINASTATIYANDINVGADTNLSLQAVGANNTTSTFSGAITGTGTISQLAGSNARTIALTSTDNTFTGNLSLAPGTGSNDFLTFASIGDGGSIIFNRTSWRSAATYTGAANIEWNTRTLSLATTFGGILDGGGNPGNMFANNGAGTITINTDLGVTTTTNTGLFWLGGTNTGNNTFAGAIADSSNATTVGIGKFDTGKWLLTNNTNSFEGIVWVADGTLSVANIANATIAQALGQGSIIRMGYRTANIGTLEYTGAANASTDKQIEVGYLQNATNGNFRGGGVILNNGTGTLTFSNPTFNSTTGVPASGTGHLRNLTLGGTNTGANTISGIIQNNNTAIGAIVELTKTGAGTWRLDGDNTYTGTTAIQSGLLIAAHANAIGSGAISLNNDAILGLGAADFTRQPNIGATVSGNRVTFLGNGGFAAFGADRIVNFGGESGIVAIGSTATPVIGNLNGKTFILGHATATHKVTVTNTLDFGNASRTIQVNDGFADVDAEISGVMQSQAGGLAGFNKTGAGTLLLSGANTYSGGTNVTAGTLNLNGSLADASMTIAAGASVNSTTAGTLTYNVDGLTVDQVVNNGTLNLDGLTVAVSATGEGLNQPEYILVDATGGGTITGTFAGVTGAPGYTLDYSTPNQVKLVGGAPVDPYDTWSGGALFDGDENADGVSNGLAFLLGAADPDANALGLLPSATETAAGLVLTFSMLDAASRGTATLFIEHSSDLGIGDAWEEVQVPLVDGTTNDVVFNIEGTGPLDVEATIPVGKAQAGKLFGRLKAVRP